MLVVIDTGLATTKVAGLIDGQLVWASYPSAVVRGIVHEQAAGVYCIGKSTANFQIYSVLAPEHGLFPTNPNSFRDPANARRRVLIEHAMARLDIKGKTNVILTQPAMDLFSGGGDNTAQLRDAEATLLKMAVSTIGMASGRPTPSVWKLGQVTTSPEAVWGIYDLAITSSGAALDDLGEFTRDHVEVGATVAVVDLGATGTRVHYVEWTGEPLPTLEMSRYREFPIGVETVTGEIDARLVELHGYRDVIDLPRLATDPTIIVAGARTDVAELVEGSARAVSVRLMNAGLDQLQAEFEAKSVDHVLFVGGGTHVLGGIVAENLPADAVLSVTDPCMAPVRGLLKARTASAANGGGRS